MWQEDEVWSIGQQPPDLDVRLKKKKSNKAAQRCGGSVWEETEFLDQDVSEESVIIVRGNSQLQTHLPLWTIPALC